LTKSEFRKIYLQKRLALTEAEYLQMSMLMSDRFFSSIDLSFIKVLHTFLPIRDKNEPDTWLIVDRIRREFPHIRLSIPKMNDNGTMENIFFEGLHQLEKNSWGIEEPRQGVTTPIEKIDLVIVPLLCFDKQGNRVGVGKGYYDRFLADCKQHVKKVGFSFFDAIDLIDDVYAGDVPLTHCITPKEMLTF
jgi:5-formyltetrahydrofolate cyclo-ligase